MKADDWSDRTASYAMPGAAASEKGMEQILPQSPGKEPTLLTP